MSRVAIDVHDVTCDLVGGFVEDYNKNYNPQLTIEAVTDWGFISPNESHERFMTIQDKSLIRADFLVDDKPENVEAFAKTGQGISILFDRPWNRKFNWLRARDWTDVVHLIEHHSKNLNAG